MLAGSVSLSASTLKQRWWTPEIKAILGEGEDRLAALSGALSAGPSAGDEEMEDVSSTAARPAAVNLTTIGQAAAEERGRGVGHRLQAACEPGEQFVQRKLPNVFLGARQRRGELPEHGSISLRAPALVRAGDAAERMPAAAPETTA